MAAGSKTVNGRSRRFHDPWGNKYGNQCGSMIRHQYFVSKYQIRGNNMVDGYVGFFDGDKVITRAYDRFVKGSRVEKLRK